MGTYTTNYNLFMPTVGETGWGTLVNGNFTTIDTTMKGLDTRLIAVENEVNGALSCTSVTASGKITGNGGIAGGAISGTTGTFSGTVTADNFVGKGTYGYTIVLMTNDQAITSTYQYEFAQAYLNLLTLNVSITLQANQSKTLNLKGYVKNNSYPIYYPIDNIIVNSGVTVTCKIEVQKAHQGDTVSVKYNNTTVLANTTTTYYGYIDISTTDVSNSIKNGFNITITNHASTVKNLSSINATIQCSNNCGCYLIPTRLI